MFIVNIESVYFKSFEKPKLYSQSITRKSLRKSFSQFIW